MTPEEWASSHAEAIVIEVLTRGTCETEGDYAAITAMIAEIIRAAVAEARAACAQEHVSECPIHYELRA